MPSIPRILHQTWKTTQLPEWALAWVASWRRLHPCWEYRLWSDQDNEILIKSHYPDILDIYRNLRQPIQRADMARYLILHRFGGVYADLDCECLRSMEELLSDSQYERFDVLLGQLIGDWADCAFMAATPKNPFWCQVIEEMIACQAYPSTRLRLLRKFGRLPIVRVHETFESTGPLALSKALRQADRSSVFILPREVCFPAGIMRGTPRPDIYVIHHSKSSWMSPLEMIALRWPAVSRSITLVFFIAMFVLAVFLMQNF